LAPAFCKRGEIGWIVANGAASSADKPRPNAIATHLVERRLRQAEPRGGGTNVKQVYRKILRFARWPALIQAYERAWRSLLMRLRVRLREHHLVVLVRLDLTPEAGWFVARGKRREGEQVGVIKRWGRMARSA
jgi:hypothetical protein